jgi:hypothetical protein
MWLYQRKKYPKPEYPTVEYFSVGFYKPNGDWEEIEQVGITCEYIAQHMVSWLNGGARSRVLDTT